ncbi:DevC protein [Richelia sinica FACHB-800]|uniref:DevC protein n=1 Tax=Richelia sinica FACHB-800 TaxID=1357546 RepID=A0A975T5W3_9NOST|nr:ABC transporter permease DevC [Richelia sinica]MBD2663664.1 FtsX-like permease family protein [Richelia sinica FACHB-800]QXE22773.1 DevC protein [Richelia sinica FACHB-800]
MIFKIPIAWLQLKYEKNRLLVGIAGISFAVVLMFMQLGFRSALFDSAVRLHTSLQGDIFLISPRSTSLIAMLSFSSRRLYQTLAFPEVEFVTPIYLGFAQWKNPQNPIYWRNIHIIGFEIKYPVFDLVGLQLYQQNLQNPDVVLFDKNSRPEFGEVAQSFHQYGLVQTEIDNRATGIRAISTIGLFELGTSFGVDGNLMTSDVNFLRIFSQRQSNEIDLGMIKVKPGTNIDLFKQKIQKYLPDDVRVFSKLELIEFEKAYWMNSTAIGFIFDLGVGMGLIVGIVFVYQILYTNVSDNLSEYATLKAIGYTQRYLINHILKQALILAFFGYIPGLFIASILYKIARGATLLPIKMESTRSGLILILTFVMCFISGAIALNKLRAVDPADIFD